MKIIIDPGHGGKDPGTYYKGIFEKNINFEISLKLKNLLTMPTVMTRQSDIFISLKDRVKLVTKNDLFLSIHCNSCETKEPNGFEVWYYNNLTSEKLTDCLLDSFRKDLKDFSDRGKRDTMALYVLKKAPCVASLIECGFISNENDRKLLVQDSVQSLIANSIKNGIDCYLNANN